MYRAFGKFVEEYANNVRDGLNGECVVLETLLKVFKGVIS